MIFAGTAEVWEVEEIEEVVVQSPINKTHYISEAKIVEELCFCVSGVDVRMRSIFSLFKVCMVFIICKYFLLFSLRTRIEMIV